MSERTFSIRLKAALLMVAIAALPALAVAYRLTSIDRAAVEVSEQNLQTSVLSEVAALTLARVHEVETDARAVANALALAASNPEKDPRLDAVRAVLGARLSIDRARFEVPAAKVDTVISKQGAAGAVPRSTPETRSAADARGIGVSRGEDGVIAVTVAVPKADRDGANGYVTVLADLAVLSRALGDIADTRFNAGGATLVIADSAHRKIAASGPGGDGDLAVWKLLPSGTAPGTRVALVSRFDDSVGGVETIPELGFVVALWRPERAAYATLYEMQRQSAWVVAVALLAALVIGFIAGNAVTRPVLAVARQARLIGQRRWQKLAAPLPRRDEIGELSRAMNTMATELQAGEAEIAREAKLRGDLSRFMSRDLVDAIVTGSHSLALGGERREVSVLFADVVAFTPLAESRPAEEVVTILNELFSMLSEIVFRHQGTVDKFIGDCIMAVWGAPVSQPDHARRALRAAEDMLRFLETANQVWSEKFGVELRLAIGINSGEAIVGNVGSDKRMEYTVVGDVVNVAARLEAIAKPNQVLVAESSAKLAGDGFSLRSLGPHQLTGRKATTLVYELSLDGGDA